jgi:hypothetical protein
MKPLKFLRRLDAWLRGHLPVARGPVWLVIGTLGLGFLVAVVKVVQRWRAGIDVLSPGLGKWLLYATATALIFAGLGFVLEFCVRWLDQRRSVAVVGAIMGLGVASAAIVTAVVRGILTMTVLQVLLVLVTSVVFFAALFQAGDVLARYLRWPPYDTHSDDA